MKKCCLCLLLCLFLIGCAQKKPVIFITGDIDVQNFATKIAQTYPEYTVAVQTVPDANTFTFVPRIPRDTKYMLLFLGQNDMRASYPFAPISANWKKSLRNHVRRINDIAKNKNVQTIWIGPFITPNDKRNNMLGRQNYWMQLVCWAEQIPYYSAFTLYGNEKGHWTGFNKDTRIRGTDGISLTEAGENDFANKIIHEFLAHHIEAQPLL